MRIVNARWTPGVNMLAIVCDCGYFHWHRADRWRVQCRKCRNIENLAIIRQRYTDEHANRS